MSRSVWKGPFVDGYLLKKAEARIEKITIGPDGAASGTAPLDVAE